MKEALSMKQTIDAMVFNYNVNIYISIFFKSIIFCSASLFLGGDEKRGYQAVT